MAEYVFLNPSPNLMKIAQYIRNMGNTIKIVRNGQFPELTSGVVHLFYSDTYKTILPSREKSKVSESYLKVKKNFLSPMLHNKVKKELKENNMNLSGGSLIDLFLFQQCPTNMAQENMIGGEGNALQTITHENPESIIVTGCMEFIGGNEKLIMYDTDMDLKDSLGDDFYIFYSGGKRLEICAQGNRLVTIGERSLDHMNILNKLQPFTAKFTFKKIKELIISRNRMPWSVVNIDKNLVLINDFSLFNLSVTMPDGWTDKVGKHLCSGKQR